MRHSSTVLGIILAVACVFSAGDRICEGAISLGVHLNYTAPPGSSTYDDEIRNFCAATGRQHAIVMYFLIWDYSDGNSHKAMMNYVDSAGATPMCMWGSGGASAGYSYDQICNGVADDKILDVASAIAAFGKPVIVSLDPEFNVDIQQSNAKWNGMDASGYGRMWRHVHSKFQEAGATNVQWAWVPNYQSYPQESWNDYNRYYPGNDYVDWVGTIGFDCDWQSGSANLSFDTLFKPILSDFTSRYSRKPQIIAEFATAGDSSRKVSWVEASYKAMTSYPNLRAAVWFNDYNGGNPGPIDFRVWTTSRTGYAQVPRSVTDAYGRAISASSFITHLPTYEELVPGGTGRITITPDSTELSPGQTLMVTWAFSGISQVVDAYFGVALPKGGLLVMDSKKRFRSEIGPVASRFNVSGNPSGALRLAVPGNAAAGLYTLEAVCVPAGSSVLKPGNHLGSGIAKSPVTVR